MTLQINEQYNAAYFTEGPTEKDGIVIHWWGTPAGQTIQSVRDTFANGGRQASAHFGATDGIVDCYVNPDDVAWANGNWAANLSKISIECDPRQSDGDYYAAAWTIAYIRSIYGDLPLSRHSDYYNTQCCGTYDLERLDTLAREIAAHPDVDFSDTPTPGEPVAVAPPVPSVVEKSIDQLADEVLAGAYGNGEERRLALGVHYDEVQAEINNRLNGSNDNYAGPSISELVDQVLAGAYGNGDQRRVALGENYEAVQAEINNRLGVSSAPAPVAKSISQLADETLAGAYGNGEERQAALGGNYEAVQAEINNRLGAGNSHVVSINDLADAVMRGEYGDGEDRRVNLGVAYDAVQAEINRRFS